MDDRCCCLHTLVRKYIIFGIGKKNGSRILVLDRSESVFALLKLFSGYGSVYLFLWTGYLIYKSDDSFWNWNYEKEIFEIRLFCTRDRVGAIILYICCNRSCYIYYYLLCFILSANFRGIEWEVFLDQFYVAQKKARNFTRVLLGK